MYIRKERSSKTVKARRYIKDKEFSDLLAEFYPDLCEDFEIFKRDRYLYNKKYFKHKEV